MTLRGREAAPYHNQWHILFLAVYMTVFSFKFLPWTFTNKFYEIKSIGSKIMVLGYNSIPFSFGVALQVNYVYMLHPIAGRYPIALTLPIAVTFSMIHMKMILSQLFPYSRQSWSLFCTSLQGHTLDTIFLGEASWQNHAQIVFAWRFVLPLNIILFEIPCELSLVSLTFYVHSSLDWNDPSLNIFLYFYHHGCSS